MKNVAIIGSGPAGYTAAIYAARANLGPMLFTGRQAGGQLTTTTEVENFPGFPEGIMGPELMVRFEQQATRFGTEVKQGCEITKVEKTGNHFTLHWNDLYQDIREHDEFKTVIIATGASARYLGLPGEEVFFPPQQTKFGLSGCAVCDGALPPYRNKPVVVVGGGDTACEEATHMTKFSSEVFLLHRRDTLRASKIMAERTLKNPKIKPIWNSALVGYKTDAKGHMIGVQIENLVTKVRSDLTVNGVFMAIGHTPNTAFLKDTGLKFDANGYIEVENGCTTNIPGLYAAGDVRDHRYRQAITAAGMGCMAALEAEHYLTAHG
jgi:thioredoxin reductase (NADPH)